MKNDKSLQMSKEEILKEISKYDDWYHNIHLGHGIYTKDNSSLAPARGHNWDKIIDSIPQDLSGKTVLDIGCNEGAFSIECKKRGAKYVCGIDYASDRIDKARIVAKILDLDIDYRTLLVSDIKGLGMKFDLILFIGVLYHLGDPINTFKDIGMICKENCIVETASIDKKVLPTNLPVVLIGNGGEQSNDKILNRLVGHIHPNAEAIIHLGLYYGAFKKHEMIFTGRRSLCLFHK